MEDTRWFGRYKELMSWRSKLESTAGHGSSRMVQGLSGFPGAGMVLRGDVEQDLALVEVWCDALGHWKAAGELEGLSSTLSFEAFPSPRTGSPLHN